MQRFSRKWQSLSLLTLSCVLLSIFLVACGDDSSSATTNSSPAPTQAASSNTSQSDSSSNTSQSDSNTSQSDSSLQTYTGNGFTIGYPTDWKVTENSSNGTVFIADPTGANTLDIGVADNTSGADAATDLKAGVDAFKQNASNPQDDTIDPTTTIAGETWSQFAMDSDFQGETYSFVMMRATHPASTMFSILYSGPKDGFDQENQSYFQPMLQSFTFTS